MIPLEMEKRLAKSGLKPPTHSLTPCAKQLNRHDDDLVSEQKPAVN